MDRNFENAPTHISSINICCADVSGVPAMVGNKRHRFAIRWLHYYNRCYCLLVRVHEGYFGLMKNLTSHAAACTCALLLLAHAHCCCLHMHIAAACTCALLLLAHAHCCCFRLRKNSCIAPWKLFQTWKTTRLLEVFLPWISWKVNANNVQYTHVSLFNYIIYIYISSDWPSCKN